MRQATRIAAPICRYISGCVAQPSPATAQFPVQTQPQPPSQLTVQSSRAQLSLFLFQHPHLSQKSCKSPAALHVFHAALVTRTRTQSLPSSPPAPPPRRLCLHRDMRTSGVVVVVIIIDMAGGRFAQSLTWSPRPHIAYWISCLPLLRRRPGSGNILC